MSNSSIPSHFTNAFRPLQDALDRLFFEAALKELNRIDNAGFLHRLQKLPLSSPFRALATASAAEVYFYSDRNDAARIILAPYVRKPQFLRPDGVTLSARATLQLAEYFCSLGDLAKAADTTNDILRQCEQSNDAYGIGECSYYLVRYSRRLHRYDELEEHSARALESLAKAEGRKAYDVLIRWRLGLLLQVVGFHSWRVGDFVKATTNLRVARWLLRATGDFLGNANVDHSLGCLLRSVGQYDEALHLLQGAVSNYEKAGHGLNLARAYTDVAVVYLRKLDGERARMNLEKALRICGDKEDKEGVRQMSETLRWMSWLHQEIPSMANRSKAREYAERAERLATSTGATVRAMEARIAIGYCLLREERYDEAKEQFERVVCEENIRGMKSLKINALLSMAEGACQPIAKDYHVAMQYYKRALDLLALGSKSSSYLKGKAERIGGMLNAASSEFFMVTDDAVSRGGFSLRTAKKELENWAIGRAMLARGGSRRGAAKLLGMSHTAVNSKLEA